MPLTDKQESEPSTVKNETSRRVAQNHSGLMGLEGFTPVLTTALVPGEIGHEKLIINQHHLLGKGGFGEVYSGHYQNQDVAIKVCAASSSLGARDIREFMHEVKVMMQLNHPSIVTCFGYTKKPYQIVMTYCVNGSLYKYLQATPSVPWDLRGRWVKQLAEGLVYLHGKELVHRDIKSPNVLLDSEFNAKWTDFGLTETKNTTATMTRGAMQGGKWENVGSTRWMSPEQLTSVAGLSKPSDMYSFGVVVWEIATQERPFKQANDMMVINWVAYQGKTLPIPQDLPQNHQHLSEVMQACFQYEPRLRPSASKVLRKLKGEKIDLLPKKLLNAAQQMQRPGYQLGMQQQPYQGLMLHANSNRGYSSDFSQPAPNAMPAFNQGVPAFNQNPAFNQGVPAFNQNPAFNQGVPTFNQSPVFNQGMPAFNQNPAFNQGVPAFNQNPAFNQGVPTFNQSPVFNQGMPAFNQNPAFNQRIPAFNQNPAFNQGMPALSQSPAFNCQETPAFSSKHEPAFNQDSLSKHQVSSNVRNASTAIVSTQGVFGMKNKPINSRPPEPRFGSPAQQTLNASQLKLVMQTPPTIDQRPVNVNNTSGAQMFAKQGFFAQQRLNPKSTFVPQTKMNNTNSTGLPITESHSSENISMRNKLVDRCKQAAFLDRQDKLVVACAKGDLALVKKLHQQQGASLAFPSRAGEYPLVAACRVLKVDVIDYIYFADDYDFIHTEQWNRVYNECGKKMAAVNQYIKQNNYYAYRVVDKNTTYKELSDTIKFLEETIKLYDESEKTRVLQEIHSRIYDWDEEWSKDDFPDSVVFSYDIMRRENTRTGHPSYDIGCRSFVRNGGGCMAVYDERKYHPNVAGIKKTRIAVTDYVNHCLQGIQELKMQLDSCQTSIDISREIMQEEELEEELEGYILGGY